MAEWTEGGLVTKTLSQYRQEIEARWLRVFPNLNLAVETPQGQLIGLEAEAWAKMDEALAVAVAGMSLETASGRQLDAFGSIVGIQRSDGEYTRLEIGISGITDGTIIAVGTRFSIVDTTFVAERQASLTASPTTVLLRAVYAGIVPSLNDNSLVSVDTVLNPIADRQGNEPTDIEIINNSIQWGREGEGDSSLRSRYYGLGVTSTGTIDAIRAAITRVDGVRYVAVYEDRYQPDWDVTENNFKPTEPSGTPVNRGNYHDTGAAFPDGGLLIVTEGGRVEEIEAAIVSSRPVGVEWAHARGRVAYLGIKLETTVFNNFAGNGIQFIRDRLVQWWYGDWTLLQGGGLSYGDGLDKSLVQAIASTIQGHRPTNLEFSQWTELAPDGAEMAFSTPLKVQDANPCLRYHLDPNRIIIEARSA